ncbi:hypothetical protein A9P82_14150 [Arachidicoccus ginsenosidimutans]|uniref:cell division protein FtsQ/DivIB n=1 Tax=Arachidicoccus sp. BS20 TaxID=1850526 RepID=UPI0007F18171|nr:cell division protein FtsQ/DivIB [Arachidicoccus sp. BS20]ANI90335.1 hypothetical protein A9P82_14150 [Arachidicoccus sp. BS20]
MLKKKLIITLWILLGVAATGLLFIAAKEKGEKLCKGINVEISKNAKQVFVDENGIKIKVSENGGKAGIPINKINVKQIESELEKDAWIKQAKLYFDNNQILQIDLKESDPVARIFTITGNSFYIDSSGKYLPVNSNVIARVPVFTGFTSNKQKLSSPDSALLQSVKQVANFIISDTFWTAYVSQINILPNTEFQIIPVVGNQIIDIGNADNLPDKFNRLYSFYRQVLSRTGINKYKEIDVQYKGQVVASNGMKDSTAALLQRNNMPATPDSEIIRLDNVARVNSPNKTKTTQHKTKQIIHKINTTKTNKS